MARIEIAVTCCEPAGARLRGTEGLTRWIGTGGVTTLLGIGFGACADEGADGADDGCGADIVAGDAEGAGIML